MESLWDITDDDAIAEGVTLDGAVVGHDFNIDGEWWAGGPRNQFRRLWDGKETGEVLSERPIMSQRSFRLAAAGSHQRTRQSRMGVQPRRLGL